MILYMTRNMDLARGSKVFSMFFLHGKDSKTKSHPVRLQSLSPIPAPTTTLARPQVDTLGIEFHQEDVIRARIGVPIQGASRVACHPGIANVVHLRKDRQLSFAVLHRCTWKFKEKLREKPTRQGKNEVKINDNAKLIANAKTMKNIENLHAPLCQDEKHLNQEISIQLPYINTYKVVSSVRSFLAWQRSSRNLHIAKYSSSSAFMSSKFQAFKTWSCSVDLVKIHRSDFHETLHEIRDIKPCSTQEIDPFQWWCHSHNVDSSRNWWIVKSQSTASSAFMSSKHSMIPPL